MAVNGHEKDLWPEKGIESLGSELSGRESGSPHQINHDRRASREGGESQWAIREVEVEHQLWPEEQL